MSTKRTNELLGISRQAEEQHLAQTLEIIHNNVQNYSRDVNRMRTEIDDMLEHFHDDNPELINTLENTITMHDSLYRALERNERALRKPYFGRIIFDDESLKHTESLYIGRGGIAKDATHPAVIDWRAPVANAYYENGLGKCSYPSPTGSPISIDLKLKRTYEIQNGQLLNLFDTEVISNDDLLTKYLAQNKQAVLGDIVATIQQEQNEIIRRSPYHNTIVQGVAGSGKTTVAMHRISYILYNYADRFRPEDFYIVGSNRILLNYITGVLPSLDVHGVRQMTMEQLFIRLLYEDWDEHRNTIKEMSGAKSSLNWFQDLQDYCNRLEWNCIPRESVYLDPKQFVEGLRDGKSGVYDETSGLPADPKRLVLLMDKAAVERYIRQNPSVSIQSKINMLNERLVKKIQDEFLGKGVKYTEPEKKAILKAYRGRYGANVWKTSIFHLYEEFLARQRTKGYEIPLTDKAKPEWDVYDLAALAYLYKRVKETDEILEAQHVVIDEAQDFGMMVYCVLKFCLKNCTYTIMGDVSQNIHFGFGLNDWEDLKEWYLRDPMSHFDVLKKSYRNTVEISNFATRILRHGRFPVYPVEPIIRHGSQVAIKQTDSPTPETLISDAAGICKKWLQKGYGTIAVICRDQETASDTATGLGQLVEVMESDLEKAEFGNGILVLPVEYTKGLEFDAVLILNPTREEYPVDNGHAKLLYVAATRALHELCVLHTGNLTGLIADPITPTAPNAVTTECANMPRTTVAAKPDIYKTAGPARQPGIPPASATVKPVPTPTKPTASTTKPTASTTKPTASTIISASTKIKEHVQQNLTTFFGDMPATELLRPAGHSKIDLTVRWVSRESDGLYLQSRYGLLRLSPIGSAIMRITFTTGNRIVDGVHPLIAVQRTERSWLYKDSPKTVELLTDEICLQVDKCTGAITYLTRDKKVLLSERNKECRIMQPMSDGLVRSRLYLNWQKSEKLCSIRPADGTTISLNATARYISHEKQAETLPFFFSDRGYGIVVASAHPTFTCDLPSYGSYLYAEVSGQMDYYFITGKKADTLLSAYAYLSGRTW